MNSLVGRYLKIALSSVALLAGCRHSNHSTIGTNGPVANVSLGGGGYYLNGWGITLVDDSRLAKANGVVFAGAAREIRNKLEALVGADDAGATYVYIVPEVGGYRIIVVSLNRISDERLNLIRNAAVAAMDVALKGAIR